MSINEQNTKLLQGKHSGGDYESDSDYIPSVYNSDTNSDAESVKSFSSSFSKQKKSFKPSMKKKIQLTIENLTVKTIPKQKGFLFYKYGVATESKTILDKISGTFVPGQFVAVLGASGSGKTTFLNYLSGRVVGLSGALHMSGKILINGKNREKMPGNESLSCYVQQDDILFQTMTVRECLTFAAKLKLQGTDDEKIQRVEEVIKDLKLTKCQNTKIGGALVKGISGGERKRTSIGVELITDPQLIFLDEPTTGLDSHTAASVMETLRALAASGRTVISTIHQPNSEIYDNFDRLLLIVQGKIIYFNEARLACDYFASINYKCPDMSNPADYFMSMMSMENPNEIDSDSGRPKSEAEITKEYNRKINYLNEQYQLSDLKNDHAFISREALEIYPQEISGTFSPWLLQLWLLVKRSWLNNMRLPDANIVKVASIAVIAIFTNILFQEMKGTLEGVVNRNGCLYFLLLSIAFNSTQTIILLFPEERPVFLREISNKMYTVSAYFFGKLIAEIPGTLLVPILNASISYYYLGFNTNTPQKFPIHCLIEIMVYLASSAYTMILSVAFSEKKLAVTMIPVLLIPFMLLSGFFVNESHTPAWLKPFQYLSLYKYGFQAMMLNEYEGLELECMEIDVGTLGYCNPLGDFNSPQNLPMSLFYLALLTVACFVTSLTIMHILSKRAH